MSDGYFDFFDTGIDALPRFVYGDEVRTHLELAQADTAFVFVDIDTLEMLGIYGLPAPKEKDKPGQVLALLKAWDAALADYRKDTAGGRAIISEAVGAKPQELATAFEGVVYYSLAENKTELSGNFAKKVVPEVQAAARIAGILKKDVDLSAAIDARFVDDAN